MRQQRAIMARAWTSVRILASIRCPTLVLVGDGDAKPPRRCSRRRSRRGSRRLTPRRVPELRTSLHARTAGGGEQGVGRVDGNVKGVCPPLSSPREGGDPYAVSSRCGTTGENLKRRRLWVRSKAGLHHHCRCVKHMESHLHRSQVWSAPADDSWRDRAQIKPCPRL